MQKFAPETKKPLPAEVDLGAYRIADPEAFGRNMARAVNSAVAQPRGDQLPLSFRQAEPRATVSLPPIVTLWVY